ncbi:uncharacterized protein PFB0765w-like isoform X2 [Camponotus floridanus]|uniref:uncharacterized protein PFB0765w-like isoform X2 n=1 Tax=Camponotus floridanus TaxID=104421 RepID=UPI000DC6C7CD|nr:uncharacterized protein PFB0765w-like isoform X2 [Camponotus floridanus]
MKKILFATTLLSIAMSENILNYLRPKTIWVHDKQFGNKKIKRTSLNEMFSEVGDLSNYDDDRQLPQISTRFISKSRKLPALTFVRSSDLALLPQVELLSSDKPKLDNAKPTVLISIDFQEGKNDNLQKDCSRINNHHKQNHGWQIQEPFYVDEPKWINIYDIKGSPQRLYKDNSDPYILSRGKKIFKIKDTEQAKEMMENYEDFSNKYPSRSKRSSTKNRVRRSIVINEKYQNNTINDTQKDLKKEINYNFLQDTDSNNVIMTKSQDKKSFKIDKMFEDRKNMEDTTSSVYNTFIKKYQKDKIKNMAEKLPYEFKFIKGNQTFANDEKIISFVEQNQNIQREDMFNHIKNDNSKIMKINQDTKFNNPEDLFTTNTNKKNKRSVILKNKNFFDVHNKYKPQKMEKSFENVKGNETDVYEQMKNKAYIDKLDDLNMYNDYTFISSKKNPDNRAESSNKKDIDHNKSIEKPWKIQYFAYRKELENAEKLRNEKNESIIDQNDTQVTDLQLTSKSDSRIENYFNHRKKRSACENCKIDPQLQDQWLKDMKKEIQDSLSLERRNKHSDILEDLSLYEPYVISRGKKASQGFENNIYSMLEPRNLNDAGRIKATSFPLTRALLRMLLMEMSRCHNCEVNTNRLSNKRSPRDRRGLLDEILTAYDPYYVVRGKRINLDKYLAKMRNQKSASIETDKK